MATDELQEVKKKLENFNERKLRIVLQFITENTKDRECLHEAVKVADSI